MNIIQSTPCPKCGYFDINLCKCTRPTPTPEIQELSVTAVSELIQNTAREEEDLIIPVELVIMLAKAICRTFGRPEQLKG